MIIEEVARNLDQEAAGELVAEEEQLEPEEALEALTIPTGPVTRSQTKLLNQDIGRVLSRLSRRVLEDKHSTLVLWRMERKMKKIRTRVSVNPFWNNEEAHEGRV
ncbi:unnamed protein product [Microthlaspi erraticum]|uniref:Uncharacterized protein n=1 Tax=Microthlaspi erraticum TaxID=1685480 RepID=A0A6D2HTK3_9BRAS|nr:unnamed protein product [Microthlaspi erraticum]